MEDPVVPDDPTVSKRSVGVITGELLREHVKRVEAKPSAPDDPKEHRSNARSNDVSRVLKIPSVPDDPTRTG